MNENLNLDKEFIPIMDNFCDEVNGVFWGEITEIEEKIMNYTNDQSLKTLSIKSKKLQPCVKRLKINKFEEKKLNDNDDGGNDQVNVDDSIQVISPKIHFYKLLPPTPKWNIQHLAASTPLPKPKKLQKNKN